MLISHIALLARRAGKSEVFWVRAIALLILIHVFIWLSFMRFEILPDLNSSISEIESITKNMERERRIMEHHDSEEESLKKIGEICVTFSKNWNDWDHYPRHWKPRVQYGIVYCDPQDFPPGIADSNVGQLIP